MSDEEQRAKIRSLLENGLETQTEPRADTDDARRPILDEIRGAHGVEDKIKIAGFTLQPVSHEGTEEACESCMYFAVRRRYCELPELAVPVEPEWSCRLWRI